jgi:glycerol-1-phosphate dehydrogenase [NAD(P)+]
LRRQLIPWPELKGMLVAAGAPVEPEDIGISRARLRESFGQAYFLRRRITALDLAARCGLLEPALNQLFGPEGLWPVGKLTPRDASARMGAGQGTDESPLTP